uniref:Uncharacterized protein n=1 Tax=Kalanchoe fedtschenkoi TaxID=63787 RepID=A0A7N0U8T4_KALFE
MSSQSSGHNPGQLLSLTSIAKFVRTHLRSISYLILLSPYILKLLSFLILSPILILLILLLATALCAFSATTHSTASYLLLGNETEDKAASSSLPEAEAAYKVIFETFHDSVTDLADASGEVEAYKKMENDALAPEIVKSCCSSTPLQDHLLVQISPICGEAELPLCEDQSPSPTSAENPTSEKSSKFEETEIIKHMVCSTINEPEVVGQEDDDDEEEEKLVKAAVGDKAESPLMAATSLKSGSNAAIGGSQQFSTNSTDLRKTALLKSRSCDLSWIAAGSMRREKEWRRTLACKLFEERHSAGEDGMDMLWEAHEAAESPGDRKADHAPRRAVSRRRTMESDHFSVYDEEDEEEDEEVAGGEKMCCLQALKMSSGKVNLGIGRKNMVKLSRALRGLGWLHKVSKSKSVKNVS